MKQIASVVRLNKAVKKIFFYKPNNRKYYKKRITFGNYAKRFSRIKAFIINKNLLLKLKGW